MKLLTLNGLQNYYYPEAITHIKPYGMVSYCAERYSPRDGRIPLPGIPLQTPALSITYLILSHEQRSLLKVFRQNVYKHADSLYK